MRHYPESSSLEKKAGEAGGRTECTDRPIYKSCKTSGMFIDACDFIYLSAFKTGYNTRKKETGRFKKKKTICFASVANPVNVARWKIGGLSGTNIRRMDIAGSNV